MKRLSEKLTQYVVESGTVSPESYAIYQYGFQIGLEMLACFGVCFGIALLLHMVPEFIISTGIFIMLRSFAGGVHLNTFWGCFVCSVGVQTMILIVGNRWLLPLWFSWLVIIFGSVLIWKQSPVETVNRKLDANERQHCKRTTLKLIFGILCFTGVCTAAGMEKFVSLIAMTMVVVLISQCIGIAKLKIENCQ